MASRALRGAAALARCWPRAFEAMVCYAGDVDAAGSARDDVPLALSVAAATVLAVLAVAAGEAALSAHNAAVLVARGAVEPADDVFRRCSGPIRSASWRWASKAR